MCIHIYIYIYIHNVIFVHQLRLGIIHGVGQPSLQQPTIS